MFIYVSIYKRVEKKELSFSIQILILYNIYAHKHTCKITNQHLAKSPSIPEWQCRLSEIYSWTKSVTLCSLMLSSEPQHTHHTAAS